MTLPHSAGNTPSKPSTPRSSLERASLERACLLTAAASGDESAWRELVDSYTPRVYGLLLSKCRNPEVAEEITQSVFVTLVDRLCSGGYTEQGRFEAWLFQIAMNRLRDEIRRSRRALVSVADPERAASWQQTVTPDVPEYEPAALRAALSSLSAQDQEILHLRHSADLAFKQIATILRKPLGTVLARHHRALRKLRDKLLAPAPAPVPAGDGPAGGSHEHAGPAHRQNLKAQPSKPKADQA